MKHFNLINSISRQPTSKKRIYRAIRPNHWKKCTIDKYLTEENERSAVFKHKFITQKLLSA